MSNDYQALAKELLDSDEWDDEVSVWCALRVFDEPRVVDGVAYVGAICFVDSRSDISVRLFSSPDELQSAWLSVSEGRWTNAEESE